MSKEFSTNSKYKGYLIRVCQDRQHYSWSIFEDGTLTYQYNIMASDDLGYTYGIDRAQSWIDNYIHRQKSELWKVIKRIENDR